MQNGQKKIVFHVRGVQRFFPAIDGISAYTTECAQRKPLETTFLGQWRRPMGENKHALWHRECFMKIPSLATITLSLALCCVQVIA
ncbi:hypothetical protein WM40_16715 [Robbsia andropogonis]|uniref:Uncharacterized protein n=1 Tax=Robbsia andropogonis TaxID=28092 RepID=A0A0F5JY88_9BURK|nr:hypothetical protein WM40_16715 [Robbsia andropogonis]